ncbi:hypothetical protein Pd630_LPD03580 [Rhodococcus opacus PD630]|nr:hypothetical protein Pd630_LPD03580 [Rhodococcus opacus PD630]
MASIAAEQQRTADPAWHRRSATVDAGPLRSDLTELKD